MTGRQIRPERIKQARNDVGLTQADVAFRLRAAGLKTTERNVRRWETGETTPHSSVVLPLADALNVSVDDLYESSSGEQDEDEAAVMFAAVAELNRLGHYKMADDLLGVARSTAARQGRARQMDAADVSVAREILARHARRHVA